MHLYSLIYKKTKDCLIATKGLYFRDSPIFQLANTIFFIHEKTKQRSPIRINLTTMTKVC